MLILVEPIFSQNDKPDKHMIDIKNYQEVNSKIIAQLRSLFPEPGRQFKNLLTTNIYTIQTLPTQTNASLYAEDWMYNYFNVLEEQPEAGYPIDIVLDADIRETWNMKFEIFLTPDELIGLDNSQLLQFTSEPLLSHLRAEGVQLKGFNLREIILNNTTYIGANFSGSTIEHSQFQGTMLILANFTGTDCLNCDFTGADLRYANLSGTKFTGSNLTKADLRYATFDAETDFSGCLLSGTKFLENATDETIQDENMTDAVFFEDTEEELDEENANELADAADAELNAEYSEAELQGGERLPPIIIDPQTPINDSEYTYNDIVLLLTPQMKKVVKLPLSQMKAYSWYGIHSLGNTSIETWRQVGLKKPVPMIGDGFKCIMAPPAEEGEAIVYESGPACMAVHDLKFDLNRAFKIFYEITGIEREAEFALATPQQALQSYATDFYKMLIILLGKHNTNENVGDTQVFDNLAQRKKMVKHAIYHYEEGLIIYSGFDTNHVNSVSGIRGNPRDLLVIMKFVELLPEQLQVDWAQHYINEFITGYGKELATFDPSERSELGFIASCINGNMEKIMLTFSAAIRDFYKSDERKRPSDVTEEEAASEKRQNLIATLTGSEFQAYFKTLRDDMGPSIAGYTKYIEEKDGFSNEKRRQMLLLLNEPDIIAQLEEQISYVSGGGKRNKKQTMGKVMRKRTTLKVFKKNKNKNKKNKPRVTKKKLVKKERKRKTIKRNRRIKGRKTLKRA
jgi:uncharacterized protein YjbI with pentapeptide repeats